MKNPSEPSRKIIGLLVGLTALAALKADERRIFLNNSKSDWTLTLLPRKQPEVGNMRFSMGGQETVLGQDSSAKSLVLPAGGTAVVEFTTRNGAYYHAFKLSSKERYVSFYADRPLVSILSPRVALGDLKISQNPPAVAINSPVKGDLTILADVPAPRPASMAFEVRNSTQDPGWRFGNATENNLGVKVLGPGGAREESGDLPLQKIPAGGTFQFWLEPVAGQTVTLSHYPARATRPDQQYMFKVSKVAGTNFPDDLIITPVQVAKGKSWVFANRFAFDGYLEIENPDADLDFGTENVTTTGTKP